jgi:hypothetical protein
MWLKPGAVHDAIPKKWGLLWNDTAVESAPRFLTVDEKRVFKCAKRLSFLKTQAFVVKTLAITCADPTW